MKRLIFTAIAAIMLAATASAAENTDSINTPAAPVATAKPIYRNVYGEIYGPSNWIGASFDSRIKPGSPWGYRAGISYISDYQTHTICHGVGIPLEFNCILGHRASKFEVGVGVNLIVYRKDYNLGNIAFRHYLRSGFGYYTYFNIGYRLQYKSGFNFRAGISPSFSWGTHAVYKSVGMQMMPYLSFGYTFKD